MKNNTSSKSTDFSTITEQLNQDLSAITEKIVADFYQFMPKEYFEKVSEATQMDHLKTIIASKALNVPQSNFLLKDNQNQYTFISNASHAGQLAELVKQLPDNQPLSSADIFTSSDNQFVVDVFSYAPHEQDYSYEQSYLEKIANTEASIVECQADGEISAVKIYVDNADSNFIFKRLVRHCAKLGIDIRAISLFNKNCNNSNIAILNLRMKTSEDLKTLESQIKKLIYLNEETLKLAYELEVEFEIAELLQGLVSIIHHQLAHLDRTYFTVAFISKVIIAHREALSPYFRELFSALEQNTAYAPNIPAELYALTARSQEKEVLDTFLKLLSSIDSSNLNSSDRLALALSIKSDFFEFCPLNSQGIFAVYFVTGNKFEGYHVRFDNIARGGLRILRPQNNEVYGYQKSKVFEEAYNLAKAQHLKNKDIPEGGSKAALLVHPTYNHEKAGRCFIDGLLDLLLNNYPAKSELIFLGPDENVSNDLINWAIECAARKKHPIPSVFMSSKPGAGINHKEYGITSEGVNVYVKHALQYVGIDPKVDAFTVKMTGGTNGDVAGNMVKILFRDYPAVKIIGLADGTAAVEDLEGLSKVELLRLVAEDLPLIEFNPESLSKQGLIHDASNREGEKARNSQHNRLQADVFIPAGGRPKTINSHNYQDFLNSAGQPSSKIIVEGANLFLSQNARNLLSDLGVLIFKDSSANKCGVICSSFEILAGMLLCEEEFLANKDLFVEQVIEKLILFAELEAQILLRTLRLNPELQLPNISMRLSESINRVTTTIQQNLDIFKIDSKLSSFFIKHYIPKILIDKIEYAQSSSYFQKQIATIIACKIIYYEGIEFFEKIDTQAVVKITNEYLSYEARIFALIEKLEQEEIANKQEIINALLAGGAGSAYRGVH